MRMFGFGFMLQAEGWLFLNWPSVFCKKGGGSMVVRLRVLLSEV
jgi:hypothetical protein